MKTAVDDDPISLEEHEANLKYFAEYMRAFNNGDEETAARLFPKIKPPAFILKVFKDLYGAEGVRSVGFNTSRADKLYGEGWLDR